MMPCPRDRAVRLGLLGPPALLVLALALASTGCAEATEEPEPPPALLAATEARTVTTDAFDDFTCTHPTPSQGTLMMLGHSAPVAAVAQSASRIASADRDQWILRDRASRQKLASGRIGLRTSGIRVDLAGDVLMLPGEKGIELRDAANGALRTVVAMRPSAAPALSPDGRYLYAIDFDVQTLHVWETGTGALRTSQLFPGSAQTRVVADGEQLRIVPNIPDGADVRNRRVQTLSFETGEVRSSTGTYRGELYSWFLDGSHFITVSASVRGSDPTLSVYTADAVLVQTIPWRDMRNVLPSDGDIEYNSGKFAGGAGEHFWVSTVEPDTTREVTRVYRLGTPEPVLKFEGVPLRASGRSAFSAFAVEGNVLRYLDLRGAAPVVRDYPLGVRRAQVQVVDAAGRFLYADASVVYDGSQPDARGRARQLDCGSIVDIAASADRLAVATTDHTLRTFVLQDGVPTLRAKIEGVDVRSLALGEDGRRLLVREYGPGEPRIAGSTVYVYELDSEGRPHPGTPLQTNLGEGNLFFAASAVGPRVALATCTSALTDCQIRVVDDGQTIFEARTTPPGMAPLVNGSTFPPVPVLSPSGRNLAIVNVTTEPRWAVAMNVLEDFVFKSQLPDVLPKRWLDEERILVARAWSAGSAIVDRSGKVLVSSNESMLGRVASAGAGRFHDEGRVYSATDLRVLWSAWNSDVRPGPSQGSAFVGDYFVYRSGWALRLVKVPVAPQ